jgi:hypothetical protein
MMGAANTIAAPNPMIVLNLLHLIPKSMAFTPFSL